jgi:hypothetical protein
VISAVALPDAGGAVMSCSVVAMMMWLAVSSLSPSVLARVLRSASDRASWTAAQTVSSGVSRAARLPGRPLSAHCCGSRAPLPGRGASRGHPTHRG